jgi:hypothetical protein
MFAKKWLGFLAAGCLVSGAAWADTDASHMAQYERECGAIRAQVSAWLPGSSGELQKKLNEALGASFNCQQASGGKTPFFWAQFPKLADDAKLTFGAALQAKRESEQKSRPPAVDEPPPSDEQVRQYLVVCSGIRQDAESVAQREQPRATHLHQTCQVVIALAKECEVAARAGTRVPFAQMLERLRERDNSMYAELVECDNGHGPGCVVVPRRRGPRVRLDR